MSNKVNDLINDLKIDIDGEKNDDLLDGVTDAWYKGKTGSSYYYSPFIEPKSTFIFAGGGNNDPSPAELTEYLNNGSDHACFSVTHGIFQSPSKSKTELAKIDPPPGAYRWESASGSIPERLVPITIRSDHYEDIGGSSKRIQERIDAFLNHKATYKDLDIFYKLGILCYGGPGNGKTGCIRHIMHKIMEKSDAIVIWLRSRIPTGAFLAKLDKCLPNRLKIFIFEELLATIDYEDTDAVLDFLDGEDAVENSIVIATTNYPEKLPGNMVDRPSRFDHLEKFDNPCPAEVVKLLTYFLKREPREDEVLASKDLSLASIKEASLRLHILGVSYLESAKAMKARSELIKKAFAQRQDEFGFSI